MTRSYSLTENVHFCEVAGATVFLDVRQDRYVLLPATMSRIIGEISDPQTGSTLSARATKLAAQLVEAGLIEASTASRPPLFVETSSRDFAHNRPAAIKHRIQTICILRMALTVAHCHLLWRTRRLEGLLATARSWKAKCSGATPPLAASLAESFHRLAPFFFKSENACLFRSLLLIRYLALHGVRADWVFGVRLCPFSAHCWVEADGMLLNDICGNVGEYKPIMTV